MMACLVKFSSSNQIQFHQYISRHFSNSSITSMPSELNLSFKLDDDFVEKYRNKEAPFGFNGLGELVYRRTYSREIEGRKEEWFETVRRVVEGTYSIQKNHIENSTLGWNDEQGQASAQEMYDLIFNMKFLPPGRGLYCMGTNMVHGKNLAAALNNCAFVSTETIDEDLTKPFEFLMDATMLGVGVGFDTKGANKLSILGPDHNLPTEEYQIDDSREGWVRSMGALLMSYFGENGIQLPPIKFDYSLIRPKGSVLKTFGGKSSGPQPLIELHNNLVKVLDKEIGKKLSSTCIVDIFNLIGKCVVGVGNIRCAEIAFGDEKDEEFLSLKDYEKNPHRMEYGWTSNNSVFGRIGMNYEKIAQHIIKNGEPGLCWLDNMKKYSRMCDPPDNKDKRVQGGNPCLEQSLESYELCCLVETFPSKHETKEQFLRTLKFAYLYAKTVTLCMTHWPATNRVMLRNRRIGCSVSGIAQFLSKNSLDTLRDWLDNGYKEIQKWDDIYSKWLCIPHSIKTTSVKPSGTVSLLAGATPGIHYPESRFYIRRVRILNDNPMLKDLKNAGYKVEQCVGQEDTTSVVEIPVDIGEGVRVASQVTMFEQFSLASFMQKYWADNQVSCTISFDPVKEGPHIASTLSFFQYELKGISLLPRIEYGAYPQMPYEEISEEEYKNKIQNIKPIEWSKCSSPKSQQKESPTTVKSVAMIDNINIKIEEEEENKKKTNNIQNGNNKYNKYNNNNNGGSKKYMGFKIHLETSNDEEEEGAPLCAYPDAVSFCDSEKCQLY